jgi:hypothetical protein
VHDPFYDLSVQISRKPERPVRAPRTERENGIAHSNSSSSNHAATHNGAVTAAPDPDKAHEAGPDDRAPSPSPTTTTTTTTTHHQRSQSTGGASTDSARARAAAESSAVAAAVRYGAHAVLQAMTSLWSASLGSAPHHRPRECSCPSS